jgi:DNA-binding ferritin-like protein
MASIFPNSMIQTSGGELSPDVIATRLTQFELQLHNFHWNTRSYAEHMCLGGLYSKVFELKDDIIEKIMGYTGIRANIGTLAALKPYSIGSSEGVVNELKLFAKQLENYGATNNMPDIENIAQGLSGDCAKSLYLLTLS